MIPRVVISMSLVDTDGESAETLAFLSASKSTGATDVYDQEANVGRLAEQMVRELFRRLAIGKPDNLIVLDIVTADRNRIIADWLREKAGELTDTPALLCPSQRLYQWAKELAPTAAEFAADHPPKPLDPLAFRKAIEAARNPVPPADAAIGPTPLGLRSETVAGAEPTWPNQMTPEHCRAVEAFRGFAAGEPRSVYGVSRLRASLSSHVVLDFRPSGGRFVVSPNGEGKPPADVAFAGARAECVTFAEIANAELVDKPQISESK